VKFVRIGDEYRFCHYMGVHWILLKKNEKAYSAGFISVDLVVGDFELKREISSSLNLGPASDDGKKLSKCLGLKERIIL